MPGLEFLYLAHNQIGEIPEDNSALWGKSALKVLDFEGNRLKHIPSAMFIESKLHNLNLKDN